MNFKLEDFTNNGVAFPFKINNSTEDFEGEYFRFQELAQKNFGKKLSLKPNLLSPFFDKLATHPDITKKIKKIIGENIYIWSSAFFAKAPGEGKIVSFHQDNPYWQLSSDKVVTAWIALTNSDKESGALEVVPSSHKIGLINKLDVSNPRKSYLDGKKTTPDNDLLSYSQNLDDFVKKNKPVSIDLSPQQFSIHHVNAVHGSGVNETKNHRIGFAVRYISSETTHLQEKSDLAIHLCGSKNSYYKEEKRPIENFGEEEIKTYNMSMSSAGAFGNKKY